MVATTRNRATLAQDGYRRGTCGACARVCAACIESPTRQLRIRGFTNVFAHVRIGLCGWQGGPVVTDLSCTFASHTARQPLYPQTDRPRAVGQGQSCARTGSSSVTMPVTRPPQEVRCIVAARAHADASASTDWLAGWLPPRAERRKGAVRVGSEMSQLKQTKCNATKEYQRQRPMASCRLTCAQACAGQ